MSDITESECWNCGSNETVVHAGEDSTVYRCSRCNKIIAEGNRHFLSWAENREQAQAFKERNPSDTTTGKIIETMREKYGKLKRKL